MKIQVNIIKSDLKKLYGATEMALHRDHWEVIYSVNPN